MNPRLNLSDVFKKLSTHEALRQGDPVAAYRLVLKWSAQALKIKNASLYFFTKDRLQLRCMEQYQHPSKWIQGGLDFKTGEMPTFFLAVERGGVLAVSDAENDSRTEAFFDRFLQIHGFVSLMVAPVRILGDQMGLITLNHVGAKREWTHEERTFAGDMGNLAAQVLVNSKRLRVEDKLRRYRGRLETLVEQRTQQLAKTNADLKREIQLRKQSENAFKESEERYRHLFRSSPFGIFYSSIAPADGRGFDVNPAMARMLGYDSPEDLLHTVNESSVVEAIYAEPAEKRKEIIAAVLSKKGWYTFEQRYRKKDGSLMIASQQVRAVRDKDGKPLMLEGFVQDITRRKHAEQEARTLQEQLFASQKREAIGILAGGIAHDFNNLLSPIIGFAELTALELPPESKLRTNIDQILTAAGRAKELARQILTFSHKGKQERRPVLVQSLIQEATQLLQHSLPSTIIIRTDAEEHCDPVLADPTQIQQVLMNLGTNAYHAMKTDGGSLRIRLKPVEIDLKTFPELPDLTPGPYVELSIADTGCGMEPGVLEKVFDPYFTTKEVGEGTGLGLSVVHGIVKSHGGGIAVDSRPGEGTTFRIYLPRLTSEPHDIWESVEETVCLGQRQHVLMVDDEKQILEVMREMLEFCDYDVEMAMTGEQAIAAIRGAEMEFDAVITDLTMPGMTGVQLAREVAAIRPDLPVILCTGFSDALTEAQVKAASIRKLLLKPVGMKALSSALLEVLGGD